MEQESQSHLDNEAQGTDTLEAPAEGTLEDNGHEDTSSDDAHPEEGQNSGGEDDIFLETGGRKFKTKDEFVSFYNKQRGATSRVVAENKELRTRLERIEAQISQSSQQPAAQQAQVEQIDEEVAKAADVLAKTGKFVSPQELKAMQEQLAALQAYSDSVKYAAADQEIKGFLAANPDAVGQEQELADLIRDFGLDKKGTKEGLVLAYRMHFGRSPKEHTPSQVALKAYEKGQQNGIRKSQAGGAPSNASGSQVVSGVKGIDFSLLD